MADLATKKTQREIVRTRKHMKKYERHFRCSFLRPTVGQAGFDTCKQRLHLRQVFLAKSAPLI